MWFHFFSFVRILYKHERQNVTSGWSCWGKNVFIIIAPIATSEIWWFPSRALASVFVFVAKVCCFSNKIALHRVLLTIPMEMLHLYTHVAHKYNLMQWSQANLYSDSFGTFPCSGTLIVYIFGEERCGWQKIHRKLLYFTRPHPSRIAC